MSFDLLKRLIEINSVFPNESHIAEFLESELKRIGFKVERQMIANNRFNLLAENGNGSESILFYGHMDTVPPYGKWNTDPFKPVIKGDIMYGLGSVDMKSGLFAILKAAEKIPKANGKKIKVAFCVDEENISEGAWKLKNTNFLDDVKIAIAAETGNIHPFDKDIQWVHLGRRGRSAIKLIVPGLSAHGAFPEKGMNAIEQAALLIENFKNFKMNSNKIMGESSCFVKKIHSDSGSLSIPDECILELSYSLVPPETPESSLHKTKSFINNLYSEGILKPINSKKISVRLANRKTPYAPPYITDIDSNIIKSVLSTIKNITKEVKVDYGLSVADENVIAASCNASVISIGPSGDNEHTADEWVNLKSVERLVKIYEQIINYL